MEAGNGVASDEYAVEKKNSAQGPGGTCQSDLNHKLRLSFLFCLTTVLCFVAAAGFGDKSGVIHFVKDHQPLEILTNTSEKRRVRDKLYLAYTEATESLARIVSTKRKQRLPDIIGVGVEKCGTGPLRWMLLQHPMILSSDPAEVHFFDSLKYQKGIEYYRSFMPEVADHELVFEKSPSYFMASKYTPMLIRKNLPNAKLIVVLCDPVNRTFSDFVQEIRMHNIPENSKYENVLYQQFAILSNNISQTRNDDDAVINYIQAIFRRYRNTHIVTAGLYYYHLKRWFKEYDRSDIHIVDGEELIYNPGMAIEKVQDFLGIPKLIIAEDFVRGDSGFYCISGPSLSQTSDPQCMPTSSKGRTRMGNWKYKPSPLAIRALRQFYAPYNEKLFEFLGRKFNWQ